VAVEEVVDDAGPDSGSGSSKPAASRLSACMVGVYGVWMMEWVCWIDRSRLGKTQKRDSEMETRRPPSQMHDRGRLLVGPGFAPAGVLPWS